QEFVGRGTFYIVAPGVSREHSLARESAGQRRCGPLPRASARRRRSLEGWGALGLPIVRDASGSEKASAFSRALPTPAFGPTATGSAGLRAWNRPAPAGPLRGFRAGSGGSAGRGSGTASLFGG